MSLNNPIYCFIPKRKLNYPDQLCNGLGKSGRVLKIFLRDGFRVEKRLGVWIARDIPVEKNPFGNLNFEKISLVSFKLKQVKMRFPVGILTLDKRKKFMYLTNKGGKRTLRGNFFFKFSFQEYF